MGMADLIRIIGTCPGRVYLDKWSLLTAVYILSPNWTCISTRKWIIQSGTRSVLFGTLNLLKETMDSSWLMRRKGNRTNIQLDRDLAGISLKFDCIKVAGTCALGRANWNNWPYRDNLPRLCRLIWGTILLQFMFSLLISPNLHDKIG